MRAAGHINWIKLKSRFIAKQYWKYLLCVIAEKTAAPAGQPKAGRRRLFNYFNLHSTLVPACRPRCHHHRRLRLPTTEFANKKCMYIGTTSEPLRPSPKTAKRRKRKSIFKQFFLRTCEPSFFFGCCYHHHRAVSRPTFITRISNFNIIKF